MAKQKRSGLGRGLDSLFEGTANSAPVPEPAVEPVAEPAAPAPSAAPAQAAPQEEAHVAAPAPTAAAQKSAPEPIEEPVERREAPKPVEKAPHREEINIVFSEDDLENARVVEREARKTTVRDGHTKKKKPTRRRPESRILSSSAPRATVSAEPETSAANVAPTRQQPVQETPQKEAAPVLDTKGSVGEIPISQLFPNPNQPRTRFKKEDLDELASSIKRDGLLQPILVRKAKGGYEIIAGERRYQACLMVGMETVPVRFWLADEDKALELALIENIQRSDLNPIEEAYGYKRLMERKGMTQSEVAQTVSKGRSTIANALRLLDLPEEAQELLFEEKITAGHARAILAVATQEGRANLTKKLREENLSVRETESLARLLNGRQAAEEGRKNRQPTPASFKRAGRRLQRVLHTPVRVKTVKGKNKIEIHFSDEEQLQRLLNALVKVKVELPETTEETETPSTAAE